MSDGLTTRVRAWQGRGQSEEFRGYGIHTFRQKGEGPLLLLLHGFPSSSYDWRLLLEQELPPNRLAFDFLGFGLSDKPRDHDYSLFWQADLTEELVRRHGDGRPVLIVAHDMGTSVANELMARDLEGKLEMEIAGIGALQRQHGAGSGQPDACAKGAAQPFRPTGREALQRALLPPPVRLGLFRRPPAK
jgi:pimeloyl-ACP methyl ester carboxylesterase